MKKKISYKSLIFTVLIVLGFSGTTLLYSCGEDVAGNIVLSLAGGGGGAQLEGSFTYKSISVSKKVEDSILPVWESLASIADIPIEYSIEPEPPSYVTIDKTTGEVKVSEASEPHSQDYTVTAKSTGDVPGEVSAPLSIAINDATLIDGTITYTATEVTVGEAKSITPSWTGRTNVAQTVNYSISPAKTGITIDKTSGVVTVSSTTVAADIPGTYTIRVVGINSFGGTVKSTLVLTATGTDNNLGGGGSTPTELPDFSYDTTQAIQGLTINISPKNVVASGQAKYQIASGTSFPTGIGINEDSGVITVSPSARLMSEQMYIIVAKATFDTSEKFTVARIAVISNNVDLSSYSLAYNPSSIVYGVGGSIAPNSSTIPQGAASYVLSGRSGATVPSGISIVGTTGNITVAASVPAGTYVLNVTANSISDVSVNSLTAQISITVTETTASSLPGNVSISYADLELFYDSTKTKSPTILNLPAGTNVTYAQSTPPLPTGVSLDSSTGGIVVSKTAPVITGTYNIIATFSGSYTGSRTASVYIKIKPIPLNGTELELIYASTTVQYGTGAVINGDIMQVNIEPKLKKQYPLGTFTYSVAPPPAIQFPPGIKFVSTITGGIEVEPNAALQEATTYRIVATASGNYTGTLTGEVTIEVVPSTLPSNVSISYPSINVSYGVEGSSAVSVSNQPAGTSVAYSVQGTQFPTGVAIDRSTGLVTVVASTSPLNASYTIKADFTGNYVGTRTQNIAINIGSYDLSTYTLTYNSSTIIYGAGDSISPSTNTIPSSIANYSLSGRNGTTLPSGISIGTTTGVINVSTSVPVGTYNIDVTAVPASGGVTNSLTAQVSISVLYSISGRSFTYAPIDVTFASSLASASWSPTHNFPSIAVVTYEVIGTPLPAGDFTLDRNTGAITIKTENNTVATSAVYPRQDYTIRATANGGGYTGSIDATVSIQVRRAELVAFVQGFKFLTTMHAGEPVTKIVDGEVVEVGNNGIFTTFIRDESEQRTYTLSGESHPTPGIIFWGDLPGDPIDVAYTLTADTSEGQQALDVSEVLLLHSDNSGAGGPILRNKLPYILLSNFSVGFVLDPPQTFTLTAIGRNRRTGVIATKITLGIRP